MKATIRHSASVIAAGLWLATATGVRAATTATLDVLVDVPGSELAIGNLIFYNFATPVQTPSNMVNISTITVTAYQDVPTGNYGIRYATPNWTILGPLQSYDMTFGFNVRTSNGQALMVGDTLQLTGSSVTGNSQVTETITNENGQLASGNAYIDLPGSGTHNPDSMAFVPQSDISISKDFSMHTTSDPSAQETVTQIDQVFSQQIPEPGTSILLVLGGMGLLARRRRA